MNLKSIIKFLKHLFPITWVKKLSPRGKLYFWTGMVAFFLVLIPSALYIYSQTRKVEAAWFNDSWGYRQTVNITNSGSTQTNIQIKALSNYDMSSLVSAGKLQSNLNDIRFTDVNGKLLKYWVEDSTNNSVDVWVLIPSVPSSGGTIFLYYGNPSAVSASDISWMPTGGTITSISGYRVHTFATSGTFTANANVNVEVLAVGGGGAGGGRHGGGGAGGGIVYHSAYPAFGNITVTVGNGGNPTQINPNTQSVGGNGENSVFGTITALGGGGGGSYTAAVPTGGGSGGGGGGGSNTTHGLANQGDSGGGTGFGSNGGDGGSSTGGGGGGGAGGTGSSASANVGGNGGIGKAYSISGSSVYYAGGGGGGGQDGGGTGDSGGGGGDGGNNTGTVGSANTGGGGGGVRSQDSAVQGKVGGSGIVIVRYPSSSSPTIASPTNEEKSPTTVAYWKFDEGFGNMANDATSNRNNGTLGASTAAPTWQSEDQCISGKCLKFDGSDDYVNTNKDFSWSISDSFSIGLWIKPSTISGIQGIIGKGAAGGYGAGNWEWTLRMNGSTLSYTYWNTSGGGEINLTSSITMEQSKWQYITITYDPTNKAKLYVNGILAATDTSVSNTLQNRSTPVLIGHAYHTSGTNYYFNGFIDDVKIYPYARSADQIKTDYASRGSVKGVSSSIGNDLVKQGSLANGLVGYWKQDEATWSGTLADVVDSSGNGNTGTADGATGGKAYPTTGKFGNGGYFDGVDDVVSLPTSNIINTSAGSVSLWVKPSSTQPGKNYWIFDQYAANSRIYMLTNGTGTSISACMGTCAGYTGKAVTADTWHHVILTWTETIATIYIDSDNGTSFTFNGLSATGTSYIGNYSDKQQGFKGSIDELRIYNRSLSPAEVRQLADWAPGPVGYWNFEEKSGSVLDRSGNNLSGTWAGTGTTRYVQGKYGSAVNFNGSDDAISITAGDNSLLDTANGFTYSLWLRRTQASPFQWPVVLGTSNPHVYYAIRSESYGTGISFEYATPPYDGNHFTNFGGSTLPFNEWHYFTATYDGSTIKWYKDGIFVSQATSVILNPTYTTPFYINAGSAGFKGQMDEVRIYNYARTSGQIVEDMNAGHPIGGSPIASQIGYWKFDEGYGNIAKNSGNESAALNGTISGATWTNYGKFGKALHFDGTNNKVTTSGVDLTSGDWTMSAWIKPDAYGAQWRRIFEAGTTGGYGFGIASGQLKVTVTNIADATASTVTPILNTWSYVAATFIKSSNTLTYYVNGAKANSVIFSTTPTAGVSTKYFGGYYAGGYFAGVIDEPKIYNTALTADQVKLDYNQGKSLVLGSLSDTSGLAGGSVASNSASAIYCVPGGSDSCSLPVGEWNFEEKNRTNAYDTSGNGNTGTLSGAAPIEGKLGWGLKFDGNNDFMDTTLPSNSVNATTFSVWFNSSNAGSIGDNSVAERLISQRSAPTSTRLTIGINDNRIAAYWPSTTMEGTTTLSPNTWYYGTLTYDGGTIKLYLNGNLENSTNVSLGTGTSDTFVIGKLSTSRYFKGKIDQVRIYSYARTPAQVAWDYNQGKPIGWWQFDECQGITAYDSSGNKNHGTITIGATVPQTTAGTCTSPGDGTGAWYNGRNGKFNSSMSFDGADDYVEKTDPGFSNWPLDISNSDKMSISTWIKPTASSSYRTIASKGYNSTDGGYALRIARDSEPIKAFFQVYNSSGTIGSAGTYNNISNGSWYHLVGVYNGSQVCLYVNGKLDGACGSLTGNIKTNDLPFRLGKLSTSGAQTEMYPGQIDDVRIYNYALTLTQVKTIMNQGAAVRYGPVTGSP